MCKTIQYRLVYYRYLVQTGDFYFSYVDRMTQVLDKLYIHICHCNMNNLIPCAKFEFNDQCYPQWETIR